MEPALSSLAASWAVLIDSLWCRRWTAGLASWRRSVFSVRAPIQVLNHALNQIVWNTLSHFMLIISILECIFIMCYVTTNIDDIEGSNSYTCSLKDIAKCSTLPYENIPPCVPLGDENLNNTYVPRDNQASCQFHFLFWTNTSTPLELVTQNVIVISSLLSSYSFLLSDLLQFSDRKLDPAFFHFVRCGNFHFWPPLKITSKHLIFNTGILPYNIYTK